MAAGFYRSWIGKPAMASGMGLVATARREKKPSALARSAAEFSKHFAAEVILGRLRRAFCFELSLVFHGDVASVLSGA
jgi:hypothetical protein